MGPKTRQTNHSHIRRCQTRPSIGSEQVGRRRLMAIEPEGVAAVQAQEVTNKLQGVVLCAGAPGAQGTAGVDADEHGRIIASPIGRVN